MKVALRFHDLRFHEKPAHAEADLPDDTFEKYDHLATVGHIAAVPRRPGVAVEPVPADRRLPSRLAEGGFDFAFPNAEGPVKLAGRERSCPAAVPAAAGELLEAPFTGSDALTPGLTPDKDVARQLRDSRRRAGVTIALAGHPPNVRLPGIVEMAPAGDDGPFGYSLEMTPGYCRRTLRHIAPHLDAPLSAVIGYARADCRLPGCRHIARMDLRRNASGQPCFMECRPLPELNFETSDSAILTAGSVLCDRLVQGILPGIILRTGEGVW